MEGGMPSMQGAESSTAHLDAGVSYLCRGCEWRLTAESGISSPVPCPNCETDNGVVAPDATETIRRCAVCHHEEMFIQKDFNRTTGIVLVVIGAIFVPWTWGLSLLAVTILDFIVYYLVGEVIVCYQCQSVHRGYSADAAIGHFDLAVHDRHVYGAAPPGAEEGH